MNAMNVWDTGLANPWWLIANWSKYVGCPIANWNFGPERAPEEPDIPSLVGTGLESLADPVDYAIEFFDKCSSPEFASDFFEAGIIADDPGHLDVCRRLSSNWKDRSKADAFVELAVERAMIRESDGEEAPAEAWITAF